METLNLVQGSKEWLAERAVNFTASEAPAMKGLNPYKSRNEFLTEKKTGVAKEIDQYTLEVVFPEGHKVEALARPLAEKIIDDELFPTTGKDTVKGLPLLASFDGINLGGDIIWECKQWNKEKAEMVLGGDIPEQDEWQVIQQLVVSRAKKCLYMVTDGTSANMEYMWYQLLPVDEKTLIAGWKQFEKDLETFEVPEVAVVRELMPLVELPTLSVLVEGAITSSNLNVYSSAATEFIESISTDLKTDEDFAIAERNIKFFSSAEKELGLTKKQILSQTVDIDHVFKTIDLLTKSMSIKRLALDKLVKSQKKVIKDNILISARNGFSDHIALLREECGIPDTITFEITPRFSEVMKNKRNIDSMRNSVDTEIARCKIEANDKADIIEANLIFLTTKAENFLFLFNDAPSLVHKPTEDFKLIVKSRVDEHEKQEADRLEALREQAVIDAQKIVDDKKAQDEREVAAEKEKIELLREQDTTPIKATPKDNLVSSKPGEIEQGVVYEAVIANNLGKETKVTTVKSISIQQPSEKEILQVLINFYGVDQKTMSKWLRGINFDLVPAIDLEMPVYAKK